MSCSKSNEIEKKGEGDKCKWEWRDGASKQYVYSRYSFDDSYDINTIAKILGSRLFHAFAKKIRTKK